MVSSVEAKVHSHQPSLGTRSASSAGREVAHRFASILTHVAQTPKGGGDPSTGAARAQGSAAAEGATLESAAIASTGAASSGRTSIGSGGASTGTTTTGATPTQDTTTDPGTVVATVGTLSEDPRTAGMYIPPDFYHGTSYSPVFDAADGTHQPRFEGQKIYSEWRWSAPADFDPNARVVHDQLNWKQGPNWWKQDASGNWVRRPEGYGGIPLNDDGTPIFTPDPVKNPEYYEV